MVEIVESSMVLPSEETPKHAIWATNLDLVVMQDLVCTVYIFRPNGDQDFFSVEVLKAALSKALVPFYPLAGRLGVDRDGRPEVQCTGEGVVFVVARSDSTVDDFGDLSPSPELREKFCPSVQSSDILTLFQVTFFRSGEVCLGTAIHHTISDGLNSLNFIKTWSDIARGSDVTVHTSVDRSTLRARSPPTIRYDHIEYKPSKDKPSAGKPSLACGVLELSEDQLSHLKKSSGKARPLSTYRAIAAYVWRCACKARQLAGDQRTRLYVPADARSRLRPPLPHGYVGNAIVRMSASATVGELLSNSLEFGADKIRAAISRVDDDYVKSVIDYLELVGLNNLATGAWELPSTDIWVNSWLSLPIYEADFGWGKPVFMGHANLHFHGLVTVSRGPDGGITLQVELEPETLERFKKVFYDEWKFLGGIV